MIRRLAIDVRGSAHALRDAVQQSLHALGVTGLKRAEVVVAIGTSLGIEIESVTYYGVQMVIQHMRNLLGETIDTMEYVGVEGGAVAQAQDIAA